MTHAQYDVPDGPLSPPDDPDARVRELAEQYLEEMNGVDFMTFANEVLTVDLIAEAVLENQYRYEDLVSAMEEKIKDGWVP